ncbi:MAG: STAS domain-containing protein [Rhodospirillales bacterium]|jgi:anti-anti-sigma factor|nr:STAS domain-containing protein [Rhodospirillales bacterium]
MTVTIYRAGDQISLILEGALDMGKSPDIRNSLMEGLRAGKQLVVDFSRVTRIDSAIIANLVEALDSSRRRGINFVLSAVPASVMELLRLSRLDGLFAIQDAPCAEITA